MALPLIPANIIQPYLQRKHVIYLLDIFIGYLMHFRLYLFKDNIFC